MALKEGSAQEDWTNVSICSANLSEALEQARKGIQLADRSGDAFWRMANGQKVATAQHAIGLQEEAAAGFEEAERSQAKMQAAYPLPYAYQAYLYCDLLLDLGRDADVQERAAQAMSIAGA